MDISTEVTSAMTKVKLKTLKSWIDTNWDLAPPGTLDITLFTEENVAPFSALYRQKAPVPLPLLPMPIPRMVLVPSTERLNIGNVPSANLRLDLRNSGTARMAYLCPTSLGTMLMPFKRVVTAPTTPLYLMPPFKVRSSRRTTTVSTKCSFSRQMVALPKYIRVQGTPRWTERLAFTPQYLRGSRRP